MVKPGWRATCAFMSKILMCISFNPVILFLEIYTSKAVLHNITTYTHTTYILIYFLLYPVLETTKLILVAIQIFL